MSPWVLSATHAIVGLLRGMGIVRSGGVRSAGRRTVRGRCLVDPGRTIAGRCLPMLFGEAEAGKGAITGTRGNATLTRENGTHEHFNCTVFDANYLGRG